MFLSTAPCHNRPPSGCMSSRQQSSQKGLEETRPVVMPSAAKEGKNQCPEENSFLIPALMASCSLSMWARPASSSSNRLVTPLWRCPSPVLCHQPPQGLLRVARCPEPDRLWKQEPFPLQTGCSKALGTLATSLHPISYDCCTRFQRG